MKINRTGARIVSVAIAAVSTAFGAASTAWEMNTWSDFLRGRFQGVALTRDGQLRLGPRTSTLFSDGQSVIWSATEAPDGTIYLGTGHRGRVIAVKAGTAPKVVLEAPQAEVFAVAAAPNGTVYAATSPDGKIYQIQNGKATEYFDPKERYIWSLAVAPDGTLYAGTGEQGKIYAVRAGRGELHYETGQTHVTALAVDSQGHLLAGSDPNGLLYRVTAKDKAFVIHDAPLPEIRSIVPQADGRIYVAALGGSVSKRAQSAASGQAAGSNLTVVAPAQAITVEAAALGLNTQAGLDIKPKADAPKPAITTAVTAATPILDLTGVEKSAIYRVNVSGTVETLWSSKEENAYDLLATGSQMTFSTDGPGRIYKLSDDRKVSLMEQTNQSEVIRLIRASSRLLAVTSNPGQVLTLEESAAPSGTYESPVHDASAIARWGRIDWQASGGTVSFQTRSGNSARPDRTWSDWSSPLTAPGSIPSPAARFVQWRLALSGDAVAVDSVSLAYRPQNQPPSVKTVSVTSQFIATPQAAKPVTAASSAAYSITITDSGDSGASTLTGTPTQNAGRAGQRQVSVAWSGEDADGDTLSYTLQFRGEGEAEWKTLKTNILETTFTLDGDLLADGRYYFRVVASDRVSNPPADTLEAELMSAPVRIDNTPPVVAIERQGGAIVVRAKDATSPLRRCEISVDARPWVVVEAEDGVTDALDESFRVQLTLSPGEHLITARVSDGAGNAGLAKIVVR